MEFHFNRKKIPNKTVYLYGGFVTFLIVLLSISVFNLFVSDEGYTEMPEPEKMNVQFEKRTQTGQKEFCDKYKHPISGSLFKCYRYSDTQKKWVPYKQFN